MASSRAGVRAVAAVVTVAVYCSFAGAESLGPLHATTDSSSSASATRRAAPGVGDTAAPGAVGRSYSPSDPFLYWEDYPGSAAYKKLEPKWYDQLVLRTDTSYNTNNGVAVHVNGGQHEPLHLYGDPGFQQRFDDAVREWGGPSSSTKTGTIDSCGWPNTPPDATQGSLQWHRTTDPWFDDFENGLDPNNWVLPFGFEACCNASNPQANVDIALDTVNGALKPVLKLTSVALDNAYCGGSNPNPDKCAKVVYSSGAVATTRFFASGQYDVVAKVPKAPGMIWAVWVYHWEQHFPEDCSQYTCPCGDWGPSGCPGGECMPSSYYKSDACPSSSKGCTFATMCDDPGYEGSVYQTCAKSHSSPDPQFPGSASFSAYISQTNHEIDIEVPANCVHADNVCTGGSCAGMYNTANFNNYQFTDNGGTGPAYSNMCARMENADGTPFNLLGDGQYHNYTIEWHTGTSHKDKDTTTAYVNFFIDGVYMGTNNAFVPTRGSRLWVSLRPTDNQNWNGSPNNWGGGYPGDGLKQEQTVYVSHVKVTPFNEPNDLMYPTPIDQPDGCQLYEGQHKCHRWKSMSIPAPLTESP